MHNVDIIEFFPNGVRPKNIHYSQENTVNLPVEGPATIDVRDGDTKKELVLNLPVNHIQVPSFVSTAYMEERERRKSPDYRWTNELLANLLEFRLSPNGILYWKENLSDFTVLNGVLRPGILVQLPKDEQDRILRKLAPTAPGAVVESSDGEIILGVRGGTVHAQGRIIPFPVGHPRYNIKRNPELNYLEDPLQSLSRQAVTEMNLPLYSGDMNNIFGAARDLYLIGVVRGRNPVQGSWNPCVAFVVESKWTTKQLEEGYRIAVDKYEHERFLSLPIDPLRLTMFIKENYPRLVDNGLGELLLYGRLRFSDSWFEGTVQELKSEKYGATITEGNPFK